MSLGAWGQSLLNDGAAGFFGNDYLRDYTHASKTFRPNSYENAPKLKFSFHVYFEINPVAYNRPGVNFSLLVKSIKLPNFSFDTHVMNQYNRKRIVQTKIKYDPIDIAFHDDNGNLANSMWYKYYTYYYQDGVNPQVVFNGKRGAANPAALAGNGGTLSGPTAADYNTRNIYAKSIDGNNNWGYIGDSGNPGVDGSKVPFFKNITVFGMNRHNFMAYTLINPIITRFGHDTYNYAENAGVMENSMTIDYETVVYNQGSIDGRQPDKIVAGFGVETNYDRVVSPIAVPGSNGSILGQNGLVDGVGGSINEALGGNFGAAAKIAGVTYNTFKNANFKDIARREIEQALPNILLSTNNPTRNTQWDIPVYGQTGSPYGAAGSLSSKIITQIKSIGSSPNAGGQTGSGEVK